MVSALDGKRKKILSIQLDVLVNHELGVLVPLFLSKLPPDVRLKDLHYDEGLRLLKLKLHSMTYDVVPPGSTIPDERIDISYSDLERFKAAHATALQYPVPAWTPPYGASTEGIPSAPRHTDCVCDMAYTGLRYHKSGCPKLIR